jgi:hypothetical protein
VAEWSKATVLKTVARKRRGFESLLLLRKLTATQKFRTAQKKLWRGGREAEGGGLLNRYTGPKPVSRVRIPPSPQFAVDVAGRAA